MLQSQRSTTQPIGIPFRADPLVTGVMISVSSAHWVDYPCQCVGRLRDLP